MAAADIAAPAGAGSGAPSTPAATPTPSTPTPTPTPAAGTPPVVPETPAQPISARDEIKAALAKAEIPEIESPKPAIEPEKPAAVAEPETPAVEEVKPAEVNPLDALGPLPVETLTKALRETPELAQALEKAGIPQATIEQTCRDAALTGQFLQEFPTPEAAAHARVNAEAMYGIDEDYVNMRSTEDLGNFITNRMLTFDLERDDAGNPIPDPANPGAYKTSGATARFMSLVGSFDTSQVAEAADKLIQKAQASGNQELVDYATNLRAAADMLNEFRNNGWRPAGQGQGEMTEQQKARQAELDHRQQELDQRDSAVKTQQSEVFVGKLREDSYAGIAPDIKALLDQTGLPQALKEKASLEITKALADAMAADETFKHAKRTDPRFKGNSDNALKALTAFQVATMKGRLHSVAQPVLKTYGEAVISRSTTRTDTIDKQITNSRMDPKTGTMPAKPVAPVMTKDQAFDKATEEVLKTTGGQRGRDFDKQVMQKFLELYGIGKSA